MDITLKAQALSAWRVSKAVMQRIANPFSPVRLRNVPPSSPVSPVSSKLKQEIASRAPRSWLLGESIAPLSLPLLVQMVFHLDQRLPGT